MSEETTVHLGRMLAERGRARHVALRRLLRVNSLGEETPDEIVYELTMDFIKADTDFNATIWGLKLHTGIERRGDARAREDAESNSS